MAEDTPASQNVLCKEIFDNLTRPSVIEIQDYASKIGIDPDLEPQLLPIAEEGLMKPLPSSWIPCYDDTKKAYYYHNNISGKTQWEHPLDGIYRDIVVKLRSESQSFSCGEATEDTTYTRDDLPSYEEPPPLSLFKKDVRPFITELHENIELNRNFHDTDNNPQLDVGLPREDRKSDCNTPALLNNHCGGITLSGNGAMFLKSHVNRRDLSNGIELKLCENKNVNVVEDPLSDPVFILSSQSASETELNTTNNGNIVEGNVVFTNTFNSANSKDDTANAKLVAKNCSENEQVTNEKPTSLLSDIGNNATVKDKCDTNIPLNSTLVNSNVQDNNTIIHNLPNNKQCLLNVIRNQSANAVENVEQSEQSNNELENHLIDDEKLQLLQSRLDDKKSEIQKQFELEQQSFERNLIENLIKMKQNLEKVYMEKHMVMERELDEKFQKCRDDLIVSHNSSLHQIKENHELVMHKLQRDLKTQEDIIRREHYKQAADLKKKFSREICSDRGRTKNTEIGLYEKVRCEKRLLEDKYSCLKGKYLKLKGEIKLSIEKRNRKKIQNLINTTGTTTGSETEKSLTWKRDSKTSKVSASPNHSSKYHPTTNKQKNVENITNELKNQDTSISDYSNINNDSQCEYDSSDYDVNPGKNRKKLFSRLKNSHALRSYSNKSKGSSPVENLRKQLQKLEDLEDQFPENSPADTYHLRYPFCDRQKFEGSSELEFFRHRIHLERDSIRMAKDGLRNQKTNFKHRQTELKAKYKSTARHGLKDLYQEEKELTDIEVSLHRTRSLLGEKIIRLRHLEQSLQHATTADDEPKHESATLSDISTHSASSGISSTEFAMLDSADMKGAHLKESSEIIHSLETLNSEIREIWEVLNKQNQASNISTVLPPFTLLYSDFDWPLVTGTTTIPHSIPTLVDRLNSYKQHIALANAQSTMVVHDTQGATTTLVEKTKNLRQWLLHAAVDTAVDGNTSQATL